MNRLIVTTCVALGTAGVFAAPLGTVRAGGDPGPDLPLVVTSVTPARDQSVLADLSDPGLQGRITVRFSTFVRARDLLDETNLVNGLSRKCDLHDHTRAAVTATASVTRNVLAVEPIGPQRQVLPLGRYTLTLKPSIRSVRGGLLNDGARGFTTSFSVGTGMTYPPVLLGIAPQDGRAGIGRRRSVVVTFDEAIRESSASAAIRLEDRSTNPPTPIPAQVRLAGRGRQVIVRPESASGFPPDADIALVIAGQGTDTVVSANLLTEVGGHVFRRDKGPQWTADAAVPTLFHSANGDFDEATGEFTLTFRTRRSAR